MCPSGEHYSPHGLSQHFEVACSVKYHKSQSCSRMSPGHNAQASASALHGGRCTFLYSVATVSQEVPGYSSTCLRAPQQHSDPSSLLAAEPASFATCVRTSWGKAELGDPEFFLLVFESYIHWERLPFLKATKKLISTDSMITFLGYNIYGVASSELSGIFW